MLVFYQYVAWSRILQVFGRRKIVVSNQYQYIMKIFMRKYFGIVFFLLFGIGNICIGRNLRFKDLLYRINLSRIIKAQPSLRKYGSLVGQ